jgi:gliding motility-associated-like protein
MFEIAGAQTVYMNVPDTVCMSTNTATADQGKFASVNAYLASGQNGKANWTIVTPNNTETDYAIMYSENTSTDKATKLTQTTSLTLQFLTPGTYTITATMQRTSGGPVIQTAKIVALDCTMSTCNGGDAAMPGFSEDFGVLASNSNKKEYSPASAISYTYDGSAVVDMQANNYAISNTTYWSADWVKTWDHTGSARGGMLVANPDADARVFYQKEVNGLCRGSVYNFSAWLLNIDSSSLFNAKCTDYRYAGVIFQIVNKANVSQVLGQFRTYDVSMNLSGPTWQRYGGSFVIPAGVTDVIVRVINNAPGGCGNNIAIDDIEMTYCSPVITASIDGSAGTLKEVLCEGAPTVLTSTFSPAGYYQNAAFQWEMSDDGGATWTNVPYGTATSSTLNIAAGELKGTKDQAADYFFRCRVFEDGSASESCSAPSSSVKLTILPMPQLSLTKSQVCEGAVVDLQASGGFDEFRWSDTAYIGPYRSIQLKHDTIITVYGYVFYGVDGGKTCVDSNFASIKVDDNPVVEIAASATTVCVGNRVTFTINDILGTTADSIIWYKGAAELGNAVRLNDFNGETSMIYTPQSIADSVFSVTVHQSTCSVTSAPFKIKLNDVPQPTPGTHMIQCVTDVNGSQFIPTRTGVAGTTGSYQVLEIAGPGISGAVGDNIDFNDYVTFANKNNPKGRITLNQGGITVYLQWTAKTSANAACSGIAFDTLTLLTEPTTPLAGPDMTQCNTANTFALAANEPNIDLTGDFAEKGKWTRISGAGNFDNNDDTLHNTSYTIPLNAYGDVVLQWSISNAGTCGTKYDTIILHYKAPPTVSLTAPVMACGNAASFNIDTVSTTGAPAFYSIAAAATNAMPGFIAVPKTAIAAWPIAVPFPAGTAGGVYDFVLTVGLDSLGCTDTVSFSVNVQSASVAPTGIIAEDSAICVSGSTILHVAGGSLALNGDGTPAADWVWYQGDCGTGTPLGTGPDLPVNVTGTTTFFVRAEGVGNCATTDCASVTVTVSDKPADAVAGPDQEHCNDSTFIMAANTPDLPTAVGTWSISSGDAVIADIHDPASKVFVSYGDTATLTWTIQNGGCISTDAVTLSNYSMPGQASVGATDTIRQCDNAAFVMTGTGVGTWSLYPGSLAAIAVADLNNPTATINLNAGDTATVFWTATNGLCYNRDSLFLENKAKPEKANAGIDQTHCNDSLFVLAAAPSAYAGTWSVVSGDVVINPADMHNPAASVFVYIGKTATLQWILNNGTCAGDPDTVVLNNIGGVTGNTISDDQVICSTATPDPLTGTATVAGGDGTYAYQWQMSTTNATSGFSNVTNGTGGTTATYTPALLTADTVWFRRVVASGCSNSAISNAVKIRLLKAVPIVESLKDSIFAECAPGTDYTLLFVTPTFSHFPYNGEPLVITSVDAVVNVDACTTAYNRIYTATDRCGNAGSAQQTVLVRDTKAPVFTTAAPKDTTVACNAITAPPTLTATDICSANVTVTLSETRINGSCANNYQVLRKWVAIDNCGNVSDTLRQLVTVKDTSGPVFSAPAPANVNVECGTIPVGVAMTATDNCTAGTITVNPSDSTLTGATADSYVIRRSWTATDECGNTTKLVQLITVRDTTAPVFNVVLADMTVDCDQLPGATNVTANDNCAGVVPVTLVEKKVILSATCANNYSLTRTYTAVDKVGNKATMVQVITVQDTTRPVFTSALPADVTVNCNAVPAPVTTLTATDACGTVKVTYKDVRPATVPGTCINNYTILRTYTATDACGNFAAHMQTITVVDTTRPVIDVAPANITVACGGTIPAAAALYATDNCDGNFPKRATMTEDPYTADICSGYTITRRWRATDACGNTAFERVQVITVEACPRPALDPALPLNCGDNTKFALQLVNKVSKAKFTLQSVFPAGLVTTPLTQTSNIFDLKGATQATFVVTDGVNGCVSDPVTYDLKYLAKPVVNLGKDTGICQGNTLTLDAGADNVTAGYTFKWSTGETTQMITVNAAGTYTVTVNNNGCVTTGTIRVVVNTPPVVDVPDIMICDGSSTTLNAFVQNARYVWNTGETTSSITVSAAGTYTVEVNLNGCMVTDQATVTLATPPNVTVSDDVAVCPDQSVTLEVEPDGGTVKWSNGVTANSIIVSRPGDYWVTVSKNGCVLSDTIRVSNKADIKEDLGPDKEICAGGLVMLDATNPNAISYLWNDGSTNPVREITTPGKYVVTVLDRFCNLTSSDSVTVKVEGINEIELGNDTTICNGEVLTLKVDAGTGNSIRWQNGSGNNTFVVSEAGIYSVTVFNECGSTSDKITVKYKECDNNTVTANAFSPNGDGKNDVFRPGVQGTMLHYTLSVFSRWGAVMFQSESDGRGWDGTYKGKVVDTGAYLWIVTYKRSEGGEQQILKGNVTIIK